jgi:uncharacterized protein (DUF433 family)
MARYPLNLPGKLKEEAERYAVSEGVSLNQFILWAVSEKVGGLKERLDDPAYPHVTYRRGPRGPVPVLRGTGIRVQALVVVAREWGLPTAQIAAEYGVTEAQVRGALAFYEGHRSELDSSIAADQAAEMEAIG